MKKFVFSLFAVAGFIGSASAQDDCTAMLPTTLGTVWETKCYDATDNLVGLTTYVVKDSYDNINGANTEIVFTTKDSIGGIQNQGKLDAYCQNGDFFMKSESQPQFTDISRMISSNVNLMGSFLNYPNTFNSADPFNTSQFAMDGGEFTIEPKGDRKDFVRVRVYNRSFDKNEKITTPAGTFDASKITYNVEVYDNDRKESKTYKNVEWYAVGAGVVRAEAYDSNNNLQNYTVLASLQEPQ